MGCGEEKANQFLSNLAVHKKSKGNLFTEKPVFCENGASIIVSSGRSCHLYNTATGNHVKELFQCADDIISCQLHPFQSSLLLATTENGELSAFNLKTNETEYCIKLQLSTKILKKHHTPRFNVDQEEGDGSFDWETQALDSLTHRKFIYAEVKAFQDNPFEVFVWASWCLNGELKAHLSVFTLNSGKHVKLFNVRKIGLKKCYMNFVTASVQGFEVFVCMGHDFVYCGRYDNQKHFISKRHYVGNDVELTCLAFHPTECSFATGDSLGRILIWRNVFDKSPLRDVLHWHALPVHDLFFSKFGNYLFSGGEENVLVKWSLSTRNKDFLPRLSSAIHHISGISESSLLSVSTLDNRITIVDFNFQKVSTIQHFSRWSVLKGESRSSVFTIDPRSNSLVLSGKTGHIQFLSLEEDGKFIYTFDVTSRNFITADSSCDIKNTEVSHARFSSRGKWLVTAESRREGGLKESRLKFWEYREKEGSYALNTNVEFPHEDFEILSLETSAEDAVATTGADKKFRLWTRFECQRGNEQAEIWGVQSVRKYRNLPCAAADFSRDASLVAVSFGPAVTIWETATGELKCSLSTPSRKDPIKFCKFGNNESSHLVVTGTELSVSSWNTITLSLIWSVPLKVSILISDPFSIYMTAFSRENSLIVFGPGSPSPELTLKRVSDCPVAAAHCAPHETRKYCLYFLTENQDLFALADADRPRPGPSRKAAGSLFTPFSAQLAQVRSRGDLDRGRTLVNKNNNQFVSSLLDSPAHTLPNPSLLCSDVLKGLLVFSKSFPSGSPGGSRKEWKTDAREEPERRAPGADAPEKVEAKLLDVLRALFV